MQIRNVAETPPIRAKWLDPDVTVIVTGMLEDLDNTPVCQVHMTENGAAVTHWVRTANCSR